MSVDKSPVYNVKAIPVEKIQANDCLLYTSPSPRD